MMLIQALKQVKNLAREVDELTAQIGKHCADLQHETPTYSDQQKVVQGWFQSRGDKIKEILRLRLAIQRTNLQTPVQIELGGIPVEMPIAGWIHRRKDLSAMELAGWKALSDRGLKEGLVKQSNGELMEVKLRRYFDPARRDMKVQELAAERSIIDGHLEVVNAMTVLVE